MFPTFGLLAILYILMIVSFQFEIGRIFSFVGILVNLRICHLQLQNLEKLIFVSKNWPNDARVGCKAFHNLVELIDYKLDLKYELDEVEGSLEQMNCKRLI